MSSKYELFLFILLSVALVIINYLAINIRYIKNNIAAINRFFKYKTFENFISNNSVYSFNCLINEKHASNIGP